MAMPLPIQIPSSASPSASDDSSNPPRSPISPCMQPLPLLDGVTANISPSQQLIQPQANTQMKRKPSRRANTAERRATHNAVERQRRETLNGRFLDLAALLPNLSQIRRPSKSSIVNSSIAHVHASRRHRALAARELRNLKLECDSLRRELNEWRDRAGVPRAEEPLRGDGFAMILSGELEVLASVQEDEEEMAAHHFDGFDEPEDDFGPPFAQPTDDLDDPRIPMAQNIAMLKNASTFGQPIGPVPLNTGGSQHVGQLRPRTASQHQQQHQAPIIVSNPSTVSFENPAMASLFEPQVHPFGHFLAQQALDPEKVSAWSAQLYPQSQQHQLIRPQFNASTGTNAPNSAAALVDQALFANIQRHQQQFASLPMQTNGLYSSDYDDSSSVGSGRERSGSISGGSGFGSPHHHESPVSYEHPGVAEYGVPRKMSAPGLSGAWTDSSESLTGMGMIKQGLGSPITVGGGGNGMSYGMMM